MFKRKENTEWETDCYADDAVKKTYKDQSITVGKLNMNHFNWKNKSLVINKELLRMLEING